MATFQWLPTTLNFDCFSGETQTATLQMTDTTFLNFTYDENTWCRISGSHYDEKGNLVCEVKVKEPNLTEAERTARITANAAGGAYTSVLTVKQAANRIKATPGKIIFTGEGGEETITVQSNNGKWAPNEGYNKFWKVIEKTDTTLTISAGRNTKGVPRIGTLFLVEDGAELATVEVSQVIYTGKTTDLGIIEIWKDNIISYETSNDSEEYKIYIDGNLEYSGKAYKMPNEDTIQVNPNRIVENYLYATVDFDAIKSGTSRFSETTQFKAVTVKIGVDRYNYKAINNWSYDLDYGLDNFNFPPSTKADARQFCPNTKLANGILFTTWAKLKDSTIYTEAPEDCNKRYVLYYNNLYAGWDALLFSGKYSRSDKLNRNTAKHATPNTSGKHYAKQWNINVTESWKLKSDYLDEEGCRRMENVVTSNLVFLHDLDTDIIYPVNVTDTSYTEKNKYDKRRQRFYEINVERAIDMNRK